MPRQGLYTLALICFILGLMLSAQFRTTQDIRASAKFQRAEDLTKRLMQTEKERDTLLEQAAELRQTTITHAAAKDLASSRLAAGLVALRGAGVSITIDDTKPVVPAGSQNPHLFLVKDEDLLKVLNELRSAGAEAIAINNQRLVATSEIRSAGPYISVNNMNLAAPFEIKAIGDPATLEAALKLRGGVFETIQFWGIKASVRQESELIIPAFKNGFHFNYARPVVEPGR
ncbi:MAG: DUF881 domain-containing protein [Sporomusaceae bacterium]|nr:DUF881 domain-containing protein [Sporomusaceae bacterium]